MTISVRLSDSTNKRLDKLSKLTNRPKSFYIRELIEDNIDDLEDYYLTSRIVENVRKGKEKVYSSLEVRQELSLSIE